MTTDRDSLQARAQRRVRRKIGFFIHATVYVLVNLGLFLLNQVTGDTRWHQFPLLGWGLGLAIHGAVTFLGLATDGLRRRMLDHEMRVLQRAEGR
ncbi:2TM domain-containing protein [Aquabacterium humicola]|uniref:2TM domain-containing protein n=1 Tax=Aquabacterium humicola TaxID=3237377 RepID=UPI002542EDDC|nr:2TM domain-containing protein [Rubrivivax pictus]